MSKTGATVRLLHATTSMLTALLVIILLTLFVAADTLPATPSGRRSSEDKQP